MNFRPGDKAIIVHGKNIQFQEWKNNYPEFTEVTLISFAGSSWLTDKSKGRYYVKETNLITLDIYNSPLFKALEE